MTLVVLSGCTTASIKQNAPDENVVILINGDHPHVEDGIVSARELFESGKDAFKNTDFEECIRSYDQLIEYFPQSKWTTTGYFNRGLCLQELKKYSRAVKDFTRYIDATRSPKNRQDGRIRLGFNLVMDGQFEAALKLYESTLESPNIRGFLRSECLLRRGMAKAGMGDAAGADADYERSLYEIKHASDGLTKGNALAAEILFRRGELYGRLMARIEFKLPKERMKSDLHKKMLLFRKSQRSYTESINIQNPFWSTAAGTRAGELFELFYRALAKAETPSTFTEEMTAYYHAEMNRKILPLLRESIEIYELNLAMSMRLGIHNDWVKKSEAKLEDLRQMYEDKTKRLNDHPTVEAPAEGSSPSDTHSKREKKKH